MQLPKSIDPSPIIEALLEIRFSTSINHNSIFGLLYSELQEAYPQSENLPIFQIPEVIRLGDPNLKYKPYHRISNADFVIQFGPDVILISSFPNYKGWSVFSEEIFGVLERIVNIGLVGDIERVGIRYINYFKEDIFDEINFKASLNSDSFSLKNTHFRTEIDNGIFTSTLQIVNNATVNSQKGSIIDIDTFTTKDLINFFGNERELIDKAHSIEKELFFSLLKSEFLQSLKPIY